MPTLKPHLDDVQRTSDDDPSDTAHITCDKIGETLRHPIKLIQLSPKCRVARLLAARHSAANPCTVYSVLTISLNLLNGHRKFGRYGVKVNAQKDECMIHQRRQIKQINSVGFQVLAACQRLPSISRCVKSMLLTSHATLYKV